MLRRSGTFIDTMSSASNRAGIPSSVSATSNAWDNERKRKPHILLCISLHLYSITPNLSTIFHILWQSHWAQGFLFIFNFNSTALFDFIWTSACSALFKRGRKDVYLQRWKCFSREPTKQVSSLALIMTCSNCCVSWSSRNLRLNITYTAVPTDKHKSEPDFLPFVQYLVFLLDIQQACDTTKVSYCDGLLDVIFAIHVWTHHKLCCLGQENEVSDPFVLG